MHWQHEVLDGSHELTKTPSDIGADFYPEVGLYSSSDPAIIDRHMQQMASAGIGVAVLSWYPAHLSDGQNADHPGYVDRLVRPTMDAAARVGVKVSFLLEPYTRPSGEEKGAHDFRKDMEYIRTTYGDHPAFYKWTWKGKTLPMYYVYDSYKTSNSEWKDLLSSRGKHSIRGTPAGERRNYYSNSSCTFFFEL